MSVGSRGPFHDTRADVIAGSGSRHSRGGDANIKGAVPW